MGQCCGYLSSNAKSKDQKQIKDEIDIILDDKKSDNSNQNDPNQSQIQQDHIQINFNASFLNSNSFQNSSFVIDKPQNSDQQQDLAAEKYQNYNGQAQADTRQSNKISIHEMKNFTSADGLKVVTNGSAHKSAFKKNSFTQSLNPQAQQLQQQSQEKIKREKTLDTLQQEIPSLADIKNKKSKSPSKIIQPGEASQLITDTSTKDQTINNNNHGAQEKDQNQQQDKPEQSNGQTAIKKQNSVVQKDLSPAGKESQLQSQKSLKQMINQQQQSSSLNVSTANKDQEVKSVMELSVTNPDKEEEKKKNLNLSKLKEKGDKDVQSEYGRNKSHKGKKLHRKNSNKTNKTSKTIMKEDQQKGEEQTKTYKSILRHNDRIGSGTNRRQSGQTQNKKRVKFNLKENNGAANNQGRRSRFSQSKDKN